MNNAAGMWNEWFLLFDDTSTAWLGDSSGLYVVTTEQQVEGALPAFGEIEPGKLYTIGGQRYTASEKRSAECIGGQGELPFRVGAGWQARVADFRAGAPSSRPTTPTARRRCPTTGRRAPPKGCAAS